MNTNSIYSLLVCEVPPANRLVSLQSHPTLIGCAYIALATLNTCSRALVQPYLALWR